MVERKNTQITDLKVVSEDEGVVEAFTNTMGQVDFDGDMIASSAFDESIRKNLPIPALVGHDPRAVVGKVIAARSVEMGNGISRLWTRIQFNLGTQAGRDAFSNIKGGFVREWSVGFNVPAGAIDSVRDAGKSIRMIRNLDWVEVSSVLRGASPNTATIEAKGDYNTEANTQAPTATTTDTLSASDAAAEIAKAHLYVARLMVADTTKG